MKVLPAVAGILLLSALLRGTGLATAGLAAGADEPDPVTGSAAMCDSGADTAALLSAFSAREERLVAREGAVEDRARALEVAETALNAKLAALSEAEESLAALLAVAESAASDDLAQLTAVYETMKPADAAAIFAQMDLNLAAGFLGLMRPESAAAVMGGLDPGTANAISALLAGRHTNVPTE